MSEDDIVEATRETGLDVAAVHEPAAEDGGDFYDVIRTADGRLVVAVGDVSGKGLRSTVFVATAQVLVREKAAQFRRPDEIIRAVSDGLSERNPHNLFVTLFCATFERVAGTATYASAGHPSPAFVRPGRIPVVSFGSTAMMAGLFPEMPVDALPLGLDRGDTLVIYTDGVTNAFNPSGVAFGERGLIAQLSTDPYGNAADTVAGLRAALKQHRGSAPAIDDFVVVAVRSTR
jgi:sigma-B regulation protein RsbU (phosphoserine phosphatase)